MKKPVSISYFEHEGEMFRMERITCRLTVLCILSMIVLALTARHREP